MNPNFRLIIGVLFLLTQFTTAQTDMVFIEENLKSAIEQSKTEHEPICLFCYASWCPHCAQMKTTVFNNPEVADFFNQHFICVKQDMEKGVGVEMHEQFNIKSYPTFIFLDSNKTILYRTVGELNTQNLILEARNALNPEKQLTFLKKKFELDVTNSNNCYVYLRALKKGEMDYSEVVKSYFETQTDKQLLSEINWKIIANGIDDLNSREFQFVLNHQKEYANIASPERVQRKIYYLAFSILEPLVQLDDTTNYQIKKKQLSEIHNFQVDSLIFVKDITLSKFNSKWVEYKNTTLQFTEKYVWNNADLLTDIIDTYQKNISETLALKQAIKWSNRLLILDASYINYLICAKLFQKLNDLPNAIIMTNLAEKDALKYDWNHTEADELLKELGQK